MQWFRLYDDLIDDPKCQKLSPVLFKHWVNLLCLASKNSPRGQLPSIDVIAYRLRLNEQKANDVLVQLADAGLVDVNAYGESEPHNWKSRQYGKPSNQPERVTQRVAKHRETLRNADVTPMKRDETPLYTDTDTDTDTEKSNPPTPPRGEEYSDEFLEFWAEYPNKKAKGEAWRSWKRCKARPPTTALIEAVERQKQSAEWTKDGGAYIPHPSTWLNNRRWDDVPTPVNSRASPNGKPHEMSPEYPAWERAERVRLGWDKPEGTAA